MPTSSQQNRLENVLGWVRTAKENLPAINNGVVTADRIARLSGLLDRMHRLASAISAQGERTHGERTHGEQTHGERTHGEQTVIERDRQAA
jgi:hypothetical protein